MTDRTAELQAYINAGHFDGDDDEFEVAGSIIVPANRKVRRVRAVQTAFAPGVRTLFAPDSTGVEFERVSVNAGNNPAIGSTTDSAGIWQGPGQGGAVVVKCDVTGKGWMSGIAVHSSPFAYVEDNTAHDMQWGGASQYEAILGIWLNNLYRPYVHRNKSARLLGEYQGQPRYWQTDGMTVTGCQFGRFIDNDTEWCGEGIDFTGSAGNWRNMVRGHMAYACDSYGVKIANGAAGNQVDSCLVREAGLAAYAISGQSEVGNPLRCEESFFNNNVAIDTGRETRWTSHVIAGLRIMQGSQHPGYPKGNIINGFTAISDFQHTVAHTETGGNTIRNYFGKDVSGGASISGPWST